MMYRATSQGNVLLTAAEEAAVLAEQAANAPTLAQTKTGALIKIDADTDAIYSDVVGSREQEYALAEQHAQSFKTAGYTGVVPGSVQSWATAKAWTATQAADDILLTAGNWRNAQASIRANRLSRKEQVRAAVDAASINTAMATWAAFVAGMRTQLGVL